MTAYLIIFSISALVSMIGFVMLIKSSWKKSKPWGFFVILSGLVFPPLALIYVIKDWKNAQQGFYYFLIGTVISLYSFGKVIDNLPLGQYKQIYEQLQSVQNFRL